MNFEERKQHLIVKQSQMERSLEYYKMMGYTPSTLELFTTCEVFTKFVFEGLTDDVKERCKKMDTHIRNTKTIRQAVDNEK